MALSQIQCLDDNHVNPRTHESKAEFLYCEEQRLALETLLRDGREAFFKQLEARGVRGFLSDPELAALAGAAEPYDPGAELYREDPEDDSGPLSLHYWPDLSDTSTPELDMGWPDSEAYRGVTRATVHAQPPLEGQVHIKEVIRKMIAQAQKVIAVVMDMFTDSDIFRDLLDASYKRKVSVYVLLERDYVPHFLSMCRRASMHTGHLRSLRVRCCGGSEFLTHSCTKVRGHMGHRFMFIDGDKAAAGSYSFTWKAARLDRNLITVVTGQAVDTFDRLFRFLYSGSKLVDLRQVVTDPEPAPDPLPQPASVPPPSAAVARKLYNPKYALVAAGNASLSPSSSPGNNSPKESQKGTKNEDLTKKGRRRQSKDVVQEAPPLHPGLVDLEKVYLFDYLPTWPEPDPPSDVIGFINIRDASKPAQVHLQRSEMFETSQAIRFSSPFTKQKETLPEVAIPRNLMPTKYEERPIKQKLQTKPEETSLKQQNPLEINSKDLTVTKSAKMEPPANNIPTSTANLSPQLPHHTSKTVTAAIVSASSPKTERKTDFPTSENSRSAFPNRNSSEVNQSSRLLAPSDSKSQIKPQNFSKNTSSSSADNIPSAVNATSVSANYQVSPVTAEPSALTSASPIRPPSAISTSVSKPSANSPIATPTVTLPPVPKPRTVQLVIKDSPSNQEMPEVSIVKKDGSKAKVAALDNEPLVVAEVPLKASVAVPEQANKSASKSIPRKSAEDTAAKDCSQQKESKESQEAQASDKGELQPVAGNEIIAQTEAQVTKTQIEADVNIHEEVPKKEENSHMAKGNIIQTKGLMDDKPKETPLENSDVNKAEIREKVAGTYQTRASLPQRVTHSSSDKNLDSLKTPKDRSPILKPKPRSESTPAISVETQKSAILPPANESVSQNVKINSQTQLLSPRLAPEKPTALHQTNSETSESTTTERDPRILLSQRHSPILDVFPARVPTPDSRRSRTPDFRTPTSDISDGYCSTTSDEYYECSESPFHEPKDQAVPFYSLNATEDREIHMANSCGSYEEQAAPLSRERTLSSCETLNLSTKGSLSSIVEKLEDEEKLAKEITHDGKLTSENSHEKLTNENSLQEELTKKCAPDERLTILDPHEERLANKSTHDVLTRDNLHEKKLTNENTLEAVLENKYINEQKSTFPLEERFTDKSTQEEKLTNENTPEELTNTYMNEKLTIDAPQERLTNERTQEDESTNKNTPVEELINKCLHEETLTIVNSHEEKLTNERTQEEESTDENSLGEELTNKNKLQEELTNKYIDEEKLTIVNPQEERLTNKRTQEEELTSDNSHERKFTSENTLEGNVTIVNPPDEGLTNKTTNDETLTNDTIHVRKFMNQGPLDEELTTVNPPEEKLTDKNMYEKLPSKTTPDKKLTNEILDVKKSTHKTRFEESLPKKTLHEDKLLNVNTLEERLTNKTTQKEMQQIDIAQREVQKLHTNFDFRAFQDAQSVWKSNRAPSQSAVPEQSVALRLNNEATEAKRMATRELKPKRFYSRAERPDRTPAGGEKTALGASAVERRDTAPAANKEPEGHKPLAHGDPGMYARLRHANAPRPPRPLSASQSTLIQPQTNRGAERKLSEGDLPPLDTPPSRRLPPRPPAPKAIPTQPYRQLPTSPTKPKPGQTPPNLPLPLPKPSFLYTHGQNARLSSPPPPPPTQTPQALPADPGLEEEKSAFGITFSRLYSLKGLKDKMSKLPAQSRRNSGGGGGAAHSRKSTG